MVKSNTASYIVLAVSALAYMALAYATPRHDFTQLLVLYAVVFACYVYVVNQRFPIWQGIAAGVIFRLLFIIAVPALSDDYFRFIWDGRLLAAGQNPYLHLPHLYIGTDAPQIAAGITQDLYRQLNSQEYYSVYPPVMQAVFWLAVKLSGGSVVGAMVVMRMVLLLADTGSILLLLRLLRKMALPDKNVLLYALNPLMILELVGNLHFEALLIFFLLLCLYQLFYQRLVISGIAMGLAIGTKLLPLMFLPFLLRRLGWRRFLLFGGVVVLAVVALFYPLISAEVIQNVSRSLDLYFRKFEFNASIYYLLRWLGFRLTGFNIIQYLGPFLSLVTFCIIVALASSKKLGSIRRLSGYMAAALTVYLFLATTVHPWYITTLVALTVTSHFRYAIAWSAVAILSYAAYRTSAYTENMLLITLEYALVFLWLIVELYLYRQRRRRANLVESGEVVKNT